MSPLHVTPPTSIFNEDGDFKMGIKYNITLYPIFKDRQYDSWYHKAHAIASVHGTETVYDPHHSPSETSHALVWVEIKFVLFSVFCKNLQTSAGHMLVKCHTDSSDA